MLFTGRKLFANSNVGQSQNQESKTPQIKSKESPKSSMLPLRIRLFGAVFLGTSVISSLLQYAILGKSEVKPAHIAIASVSDAIGEVIANYIETQEDEKQKISKKHDG